MLVLCAVGVGLVERGGMGGQQSSRGGGGFYTALWCTDHFMGDRKLSALRDEEDFWD